MQIIKLPTYQDARGSLTVIEKILPFVVKRIYYIYDCPTIDRGGHRHKKNIQALVCVKGACVIDCDNGQKKERITLDRPDKILVLQPKDWHTMGNFTPDAVLLVLASEYFDATDYIDEAY
jgi:dTDP-4-dehydrorhamnose 3,5-epimerase-like enzyme